MRQAHGEPAGGFEDWIGMSASEGMVLAPDSTPLGSSYLNPDFEAQFANRKPVFDAPARCRVKQAMYRDLKWLKIPKLLRFQDKCAMAWGVEVRVPFLDHLLVERMFRVPVATLLRGGLTKSLLRDVGKASGLAAALQAPKFYVSVPQREWVKTHMRPAIEQAIEESALAADGYVMKGELRRQFQAYAQSQALGNSFFIWKFLNLEWWYREFCKTTGVVAGEPAACVGA
jgi:asparagine synthase (glutamine-hydrolysing)